MMDHLLVQATFFAHRGRGRPPDPLALAILGFVMMLGGLFLVGMHLARKRGGPPGGGGAFVVGVVLASLGYGMLAINAGLPGGGPALQLAGWITAIGGLSLPWLLRRWQSMDPDAQAPDPFAGGPEERLARIVEPGETVLWIGRPLPRRFWVDAVVLAFFGLIPLGFGVGLAYGIVHRINHVGVEWDFLVAQVLGLEFAVLLLCFGGMLCASPLMIPLRLGKVVYAVTDRRGLVSGPPYSVWNPVPARSGQSRTSAAGVSTVFSPSELRGGKRKRKWIGGSDLVFVSFMTGSGKQRRRVDCGFLGISDAAAAQAAIQQAHSRSDAERRA